MLRRSTIFLSSSSTSSSSTLHSRTRIFKPPALHVLFDTATNHRYSVATINLSNINNNNNNNVNPDSRAAFLLFDSPAEMTNDTTFDQPSTISKDSLALVGLPEILTTNKNENPIFHNILEKTLKDNALGSNALTELESSKLLLTSLDHNIWFGPGQRDIILKNFSSKENENKKIVCTADWARALMSQEGLEALLKQRNQTSKTTKFISPKIPKENIIPLNPGDTVRLGNRELSFAAESWCSNPIFEDLSTRSIFSASGIAAFFPWMELFASASYTSDSTKTFPLLSRASRSHPPFIFPFWTKYNNNNNNNGDVVTPLDAKTCLQLVQYLNQRGPQRLFLECYGMVSPADEFLEKLEVIASELVDLQQRLAEKFLSIAKNPSPNATAEQVEKQIFDRATERLMQCILLGFSKSGHSGNDIGNSRVSLESRINNSAWEDIVGSQRKQHLEFSQVMDFLEESVKQKLVKSFILGAKHLAITMDGDYTIPATKQAPTTKTATTPIVAPEAKVEKATKMVEKEAEKKTTDKKKSSSDGKKKNSSKKK